MPTPQIISTKAFKLKGNEEKSFKFFDLKKQFGFLPEVIIISKEPGSIRTILSVVIPDEEVKKREALAKEVISISKAIKKVKKTKKIKNK